MTSTSSGGNTVRFVATTGASEEAAFPGFARGLAGTGAATCAFRLASSALELAWGREAVTVRGASGRSESAAADSISCSEPNQNSLFLTNTMPSVTRRSVRAIRRRSCSRFPPSPRCRVMLAFGLNSNTLIFFRARPADSLLRIALRCNYPSAGTSSLRHGACGGNGTKREEKAQ